MLITILALASLIAAPAAAQDRPVDHRGAFSIIERDSEPGNPSLQPAAESAHAIAAEVLAFEREVEAAVVRGDVAFVDAASAPTFTFTHGDGWTTGDAPIRVDSRADWLATVAKAPYASRVLDSVKTEVHGDVVITYGRYVARFKSAAPGRRQFTVWYERVYAKRDGKWQYLSHRTVHGPTFENEPSG